MNEREREQGGNFLKLSDQVPEVGEIEREKERGCGGLSNKSGTYCTADIFVHWSLNAINVSTHCSSNQMQAKKLCEKIS